MSDEFIFSESSVADPMQNVSLSPARMRQDNPSRYGTIAQFFNAIMMTTVMASLAIVVALGGLHSVAKADSVEKAVIAAFGDSLTHGYGLPEAETFPVKLEAALNDAGFPVRVINAGVSGDTSRGGLSRIDWTLSDKPDAIILELGANDGLRGLEPKDTYDNLAGIIETAEIGAVRILLTGMYAPPNLGREYAQEFNEVFPRLAERYDTEFYPFFLEGVAADPELNQSDGVHPNGKGVDAIVRNILPYVVKILPESVRAQGSLPPKQTGKTRDTEESSS